MLSPDVAGHAQRWCTPAARSTRGPHQSAHAHRAAGAVLQLQLEPAVLAGGITAAAAAAELRPAQAAGSALARIAHACADLTQA